jgi:phage tail sheath gpL-like
MPDNIVFDGIPIDIRTQGQFITIDNTKAVSGVPSQARKLLVIGQKLAAGTLPVLKPTRVLTTGQAQQYAGRGSQLALMVANVKGEDPNVDAWMVAQDDLEAGAAATGTITVAVNTPVAGVIPLYIGDKKISVGVTAGAAANAIAAAIQAAVAADPDLPVTAAVLNAVVTLTSRNKGENGNTIPISVGYYADEVAPAGVTLTIAAMAAGAGNPDITQVLAAIAGQAFYSIVMPYTDSANMTAFENELTNRWGPMIQKTGHLFSCLAGTHGALTTYGSARNSVQSTVMGAKGSLTPPWRWAAALAAVCEASGSIDPAMPFQTLELKTVLAPRVEDRFSQPERDLLLKDGISTFTVDDGGRVLIERVITTYQTNALGIEDVSFLDLETKWTVDYIRFAVRARMALRFPRYKLADDGTNIAPGQKVVTPRVIRGELLALFKQLETNGIVEGFEQFKRDLIVVRSTADRNRVNAVIPPDVVNQFRIFAAAVQFIL